MFFRKRIVGLFLFSLGMGMLLALILGGLAYFFSIFFLAIGFWNLFC